MWVGRRAPFGPVLVTDDEEGHDADRSTLESSDATACVRPALEGPPIRVARHAPGIEVPPWLQRRSNHGKGCSRGRRRLGYGDRGTRDAPRARDTLVGGRARGGRGRRRPAPDSLFLPDVPLPRLARLERSGGGRRGASSSCRTPEQVLPRRVDNVRAATSAERAVVVATKGIEESSLDLLSTVLSQTMPELDDERLAFLSGPTFAREVALELPADIVAASSGFLAARRVQPMLHSPRLRVYASADPIGVQVGGAIKNVMAVAIGACDGLGMGLNARAALITRGLAEITRLGVAMGAHPLTFIGMSGVGDLVLTCTGDLSRNRQLGKQIAAVSTPPSIFEQSVRSPRAISRRPPRGRSRRSSASTCRSRAGVSRATRAPAARQALRILMERAHKDELHGIA